MASSLFHIICLHADFANPPRLFKSVLKYVKYKKIMQADIIDTMCTRTSYRHLKYLSCNIKKDINSDRSLLLFYKIFNTNT